MPGRRPHGSKGPRRLPPWAAWEPGACALPSPDAQRQRGRAERGEHPSAEAWAPLFQEFTCFPPEARRGGSREQQVSCQVRASRAMLRVGSGQRLWKRRPAAPTGVCHQCARTNKPGASVGVRGRGPLPGAHAGAGVPASQSPSVPCGQRSISALPLPRASPASSAGLRSRRTTQSRPVMRHGPTGGTGPLQSHLLRGQGSAGGRCPPWVWHPAGHPGSVLSGLLSSLGDPSQHTTGKAPGLPTLGTGKHTASGRGGLGQKAACQGPGGDPRNGTSLGPMPGALLCPPVLGLPPRPSPGPERSVPIG